MSADRDDMEAVVEEMRVCGTHHLAAERWVNADVLDAWADRLEACITSDKLATNSEHESSPDPSAEAGLAAYKAYREIAATGSVDPFDFYLIPRACMAAAQTIEQAPCEVCSTPVAGPGRRFCSLECFSTSRWITVRCTMCLEPFETYRSRPKRFCGGACHRTHQGLRQQGKRSHLWKGGKVDEARRIRSHSGYAAWRTKVFERDNYECQACFALGHDLTAHHIVAFADDPRKRLKVSNGVTLCRGCHRDFHRSDNRADILEAALVKRTDGFLKKEPGVWFTKIHGGGMGRAGLPDFFISVAGRMLTIELKVHPNFASPAQKHEIRRINAAGGIARICRSLDDVASAVDACKEAA